MQSPSTSRIAMLVAAVTAWLSCTMAVAARSLTGTLQPSTPTRQASAVTIGNPVVFSQLPLPFGITTDRLGNVFVYHDTGTNNALTKVAPDGTFLGSIPIGGFADTGLTGARLVTLPDGRIFALAPSGILIIIDSTSGDIITAPDLATLTPDARNVFDIASGLYRNFAGVILRGQIQYGDIAVLIRGQQLDLFISGVSVITPFVMRLRVLPDSVVGPTVLVASSSTTAGNVNLPRGVAVNAQGTVLTNLPIGTASGGVDVAVTFRADLEPGGNPLPSIILGGNFITSNGMTADSAGNFYLATGSVGTALCGAGGSGALVVIAGTLNGFRCGNLGLALADSRDVAVNPENSLAYMTVQNVNAVFRFPITVSAPPPPAPPPPPPAPPPPTPPPPTPLAFCNGRPATFAGTDGNDIMNGTPGDDVIHGRGGNDLIRGGGATILSAGAATEIDCSGTEDATGCSAGLVETR